MQVISEPGISTNMECGYLNGWIIYIYIKKKKVTYAKISPKMVNPRDIAGEHKGRRRINRYSSGYRAVHRA